MLFEAIRDFHTTNENELVFCFEEASKLIECFQLNLGDAIAFTSLDPIGTEFRYISLQRNFLWLAIDRVPKLAFLHAVVVTEHEKVVAALTVPSRNALRWAVTIAPPSMRVRVSLPPTRYDRGASRLVLLAFDFMSEDGGAADYEQSH